MTYDQFLQYKEYSTESSGFDASDLPCNLYEYQKDIVRWACKRGKACIFSMTGTGKTAMQASWADQVRNHCGGNILIVAPLAVAHQTIIEAEKFGVHINYAKDSSEVLPGITITNYDRIHLFDDCKWIGIVLDESSILKSFTGKIRSNIIKASRSIPYRLACTATPAPNDSMELGNHAEFVGVMSYTEMLSAFFVHDGGDTSKWRLKGHAEEPFYKWLSSWSVFLSKPSDLGYSDEGFDLPALYTHEHIVESKATDRLFPSYADSLMDRIRARSLSIDTRVDKCSEIVSTSQKPFLIWCNLNAESEKLASAIHGSVQVKGSDDADFKSKAMLDFAAGNIPVMISKPSICGFGMNWQVCSNTAFVGLSDSFEQIFQATKRFHRHGQKNTVHRHIIISESEGAVLKNIQRKETEFLKTIEKMTEHTKSIRMRDIRKSTRQTVAHKNHTSIFIPRWIQSEVACGY